ncbi:MAG: RpoL/Rpb11 RNA polymerase subunit family protein [Candidatus Aenigmatarchaeota archaeon]
MNIKIRGKGKNKLRLEFEEEGYSIVNLLRKNLWENEEVDIDKASYKRDHAYLGNFDFIVETKQGDPVQVLIDAAKKIQEDSKELQDKLNKAL